MTAIAATTKRGAATKPRSVLFGDTTIEFDVRRSRRRKKTVNFKVDRDGVHVTAPLRMPNRSLEKLVLKQAPWILTRLSSVAEMGAPLRFVSGETLSYLGRRVKLIVEAADVPKPMMRFDHWRFRVAVPHGLGDHKREDAIRRIIVEWYKARVAERLRACVEQWWPALGSREISRILVRDTRRQWGSCAADGTLRFSWRLAMVKPAFLEYVVVHELAHLTHRNHSGDFWGLVTSVMPDARHRRKRLDEAAHWLPEL